MGLLKIFKPNEEVPEPLPSGCYTVDSAGEVISSTVSSRVQPDKLQAITKAVIEAFRLAEEAQMPGIELVAEFGSMKITARDLRGGGAIIFVAPKKQGQKLKPSLRE